MRNGSGRMADDVRIVIVVNPTSGRSRGTATARKVAEHLRCRFRVVDVRETAGSDDAYAITREVSTATENRPGCVVACGGDGTMQEVAGALASLRTSLGERCPVMGLAPAGRCNDFARVLGVSANPASIAAVIADGNIQPIDLGCINGRYFCTVATVGIDAEVSRFVDEMKMPIRGTIAYLYGAMRILLHYRPRAIHIEGDFGVIDKPIFLASTANTSSYGGAIEIAPDAVPTDGTLDLCVIDGISRIRAIPLALRVILGRHRSHPAVRFLKSRRLTIDAPQRLAFWADGEPITHTPARLEAIPAAIRVLLPASSANIAVESPPENH